MPQVSVIIPTYNRAQYIGKAVQSVMAQTYHKFEIIVVDDGSTDDTEEIIHNFKNPAIRYAKNRENYGQSYSRNRGVNMARGEYIAFLDSDDFWLPDKLKTQFDALNKYTDVGLVYSNVLLSRKGTNTARVKLGPQFFKSGFLFQEVLLWRVMCYLPTWLVKKEYFLSIGGFDENLSMIEDRDFIVRFAHRYKICGIAKPLVVVLYHNETRVSNTSAQKLEFVYSRILKKISELIKSENFGPRVMKTISAKYDFDIGRLYLSEGNLLKARHHLFDAVLSDPLNYRVYPYLLSSSNMSLYHVIRKAKNFISQGFC